MQYLKINEDGSRKLYPKKPQWFTDSGELVSDDYLLNNENMYPVVEPYIPTSEAYIGEPKTKPVEEWVINDTTATKNVWIYVEDKPSYDKFYQNIEKNNEDNWVEEIVDGEDYDRIKITYTLKEKTVQEKQADMKDELAAKRWKYETNGMLFESATSGNTYEIHTDRDSQSKIVGAQLSAKEGNFTEKKWKTKEGYKILTADEIIEMAGVLEQHVQGCYDNESRIMDLIDGCSTIEELRDLVTPTRDTDGNITEKSEFNKQWPSTVL